MAIHSLGATREERLELSNYWVGRVVVWYGNLAPMNWTRQFSVRLVATSLLALLTNVQADPIAEPSTANWFFSLGGHFQYEQLRDETLNPLRFHGPGLALDMRLTRKALSNEHHVAFDLPIGLVLDRYGFWGVSLKYGINGLGLWRVNPQLSLGYYGGMNVRYHYYPEWDDSHVYWLTDYSVGPALNFRPPESPAFDFIFHTNLVSLLSRNPQHPRSKLDNIVTVSGFFSTPQQDLRWQSFRDFQSGAIRLRYKSDHGGSRVWEYRMEFVHANDPLEFVQVTHLVGWQHEF